MYKFLVSMSSFFLVLSWGTESLNTWSIGFFSVAVTKYLSGTVYFGVEFKGTMCIMAGVCQRQEHSWSFALTAGRLATSGWLIPFLLGIRFRTLIHWIDFPTSTNLLRKSSVVSPGDSRSCHTEGQC